MSTSTTQMSGWTCSTCGAWVPFGLSHYCHGTTKMIGPPHVEPSQYDATQLRIALALERIAAALELPA